MKASVYARKPLRASLRLLLYLLTCAALLTGCAPAAAPSADAMKGTLTVSGAFALYPMVVRWGEEFRKVYPDVQFDISAGGAGKGMTDALSGAADIGMVSRGIMPEEEAKGAFPIAVTKDAVFALVNAKNPVLDDLLAKGVTKDILAKIYLTGEITTWGQVVGRADVKEAIHVYTRSDAAGAPEVWAKFLGNKKQEDLQGIGVFGDPGLADAVAKDPLGVGYNNLNYAYDTATGKAVPNTAVVPLDANGDGKVDEQESVLTKTAAVQAVATGRYPSPPARALYLVTNGRPSALETAFLSWVLTDGQKFVDEAGYVALPPDQLEAARTKLRP